MRPFNGRKWWLVVLTLAILQLFSPTQAHLTLIWVVGLEGVGHHGLLPMLREIVYASLHGQSFLWPDDGLLGLTDIYKPWLLGPPQYEFRYKLLLRNGASNHTVIFTNSFPSGVYDRYRDGSNLDDLPHIYDLNALMQVVSELNNAIADKIRIKFLHLTRDPYAMIRSSMHAESIMTETSTFEQHGQVLQNFNKILGLLYEKTNHWQTNLWASMRFEWFLLPVQCTHVVNALVNFFEWEPVDTEKACTRIQLGVETFRAARTYSTRKPAINCTYVNMARAMNFSLPAVPSISDGSFIFALPSDVTNLGYDALACAEPQSSNRRR